MNIDIDQVINICKAYKDTTENMPYGYGRYPDDIIRTCKMLKAFEWEWGHTTSFPDFSITKGYYITNNGSGHQSDKDTWYVQWDNGNIGRLEFCSQEYWYDTEEEWQEFKDRMMSYNPVNYDPHNSHIVYDIENGKKILEDYPKIYDETRAKFQKKIKKKLIEKKQKELEKLMNDSD